MKDFSEQVIPELALQALETLAADNAAVSKTTYGLLASNHLAIPDQDDRYPGSFFRIPGPPIPGKTTWSIN